MNSLMQIKHPINKLALELAAFSAIFGVAQALFYLIFKLHISVTIGFVYIIPTLIAHLVALAVVILNASKHREEFTEHCTTILCMILNLPLAYACFQLVTPIF